MDQATGVFPRNSVNLGNLKNHLRMNWGQFKDPLCYPCLTGSMITSWSLAHEVAGLNNPFNYKYFHHRIQQILLGKTQLLLLFYAHNNRQAYKPYQFIMFFSPHLGLVLALPEHSSIERAYRVHVEIF